MNKKISSVSYRVEGTGKNVVLLHGFGETSSVWDGQVAALAPVCRMIIPDLPGSGDSEFIEDMSIEGMGDAIAEVISKEINAGEKVILIGHSMGGYISLGIAERHPDLVCALGLFHSSSYADSEEKIATRRKGIEFIKEHGAGEFLKTATPNLFSPQSKEQKPQIINDLIEKGNNFSPDSLVSYYEAMIKRPDRTNILKSMKIPFLFILGKYDTAIPLKDGLSLCHLPELSYIHVLHKSGHMGMLEEADLTNRILLEFISEN